MSAPVPTGHPLLIVVDPAARRIDGEAVRIAKDVLCAGASTKICLPDGPDELARALSRRGGRRPVVVGDDAALLRVVGLLHRERSLGDGAVALVPVGASPAELALAGALGVPTGPVEAARAVLDGVERSLDLLVDDSDGVVLGGLRIPAGAARATGGREPWWWPGLRSCRALARTLLRSGQERGADGQEPGLDGGPGCGDAGRGGDGGGGAGDAGRGGGGRRDGGGRHDGGRGGARGARRAYRLRVEADGELLTDLDHLVETVSVTTAGPCSGAGGLAHVVVRTSPNGDGAAERTARARAVTVSGPDFRYHADAVVGGPVRTRTWTLHADAWRLTLPRG